MSITSTVAAFTLSPIEDGLCNSRKWDVVRNLYRHHSEDAQGEFGFAGTSAAWVTAGEDAMYFTIECGELWVWLLCASSHLTA